MLVIFALPLGSPPRMRGKPEHCIPTVETFRITPADAGKTEYYAFPDEETGDHPRGCGENPKSSYVGLLAKGSPPRMRGKPSRVPSFYTMLGITPADAGKTLSAPMSSMVKSGSPPRMRGKLHQLCYVGFVKRITPADAGKTRKEG